MNNSFNKSTESFYQVINSWISNEGTNTNLIDAAYPNHDGVADSETIADMMTLRDRLNAIAQACETGIGRLNDIITLYEENGK